MEFPIWILQRLLEKTPIFGSLSTFGFGYTLNETLLFDIAKKGGGYFSFIPDSGFVGTCFINAIANARCAIGVNPILRISSLATDLENVTADGQFAVVRDGNDICVRLTPLRLGASMDIILNNVIVDGATMELGFQASFGRKVVVPVVATSEHDEEADLFHTTRVQFIKQSSQTRTFANKDVFLPSAEVNRARSQNKLLDALCKDMEGQATEAMSREVWFRRWGSKYLLSLVGAHLHQFCNNFKDPGVQAYGKGFRFVSLQEELNDIFEQIPPPKPSVDANRRSQQMQSPTYIQASSNHQASSVPISMGKTFNNVNVVCVHDKTQVTTMDQETSEVKAIAISELRKGDLVMTEGGTFAGVQCLVETASDKPLDLVQIGDLLVTPYHPVKTSQGWKFPIDCSEGILVTNKVNAYSVYNLILEDGMRSNPVIMNGVPSITLGHGIMDDPVLFHKYFGSERVVKDIMKIESVSVLGHVILREDDVKRANGTGDIFAIEVSAPAMQAVDTSQILCGA